jgi:hypothetical protein
MSGILKRTVFIDDSDGYVRPLDFALVTTTIGPMLEPFTPFQKVGFGTGQVAYDATDMMSRIDKIERWSLDKEKLILGEQTIGGYLHPRIGR